MGREFDQLRGEPSVLPYNGTDDDDDDDGFVKKLQIIQTSDYIVLGM